MDNLSTNNKHVPLKLQALLKRVYTDGVFTFLFPRFCVLCGFVGSYVCSECSSRFAQAEDRCVCCGTHSRLGLTHPGCKPKSAVNGLISMFTYAGGVDVAIRMGKYHGAWMVLDELVNRIPRATYQTLFNWKKQFNPTLIDVPIHPSRERLRGFNQSTVIRKKLQTKLGLCSIGGLLKIVPTAPQARINKPEDRLKNVRNSIIFSGETAPETAILIDDVVTTGATVNECAMALKKAGTKIVLAFSVAKG